MPQWLNICLPLRSWSLGPGMESHIGLPMKSLLLSLPMLLPLSLCLSWIIKILKNKEKENVRRDFKIWRNKWQYLSNELMDWENRVLGSITDPLKMTDHKFKVKTAYVIVCMLWCFRSFCFLVLILLLILFFYNFIF